MELDARLLRRYIEEFSEHGNSLYPIGEGSEEERAKQYWDTPKILFYDESRPYGKQRMDLVRFLHEKISKLLELKDVNN